MSEEIAGLMLRMDRLDSANRHLKWGMLSLSGALVVLLVVVLLGFSHKPSELSARRMAIIGVAEENARYPETPRLDLAPESVVLYGEERLEHYSEHGTISLDCDHPVYDCGLSLSYSPPVHLMRPPTVHATLGSKGLRLSMTNPGWIGEESQPWRQRLEELGSAERAELEAYLRKRLEFGLVVGDPETGPAALVALDYVSGRPLLLFRDEGGSWYTPWER